MMPLKNFYPIVILGIALLQCGSGDVGPQRLAIFTAKNCNITLEPCQLNQPLALRGKMDVTAQTMAGESLTIESQDPTIISVHNGTIVGEKVGTTNLLALGVNHNVLDSYEITVKTVASFSKPILSAPLLNAALNNPVLQTNTTETIRVPRATGFFIDFIQKDDTGTVMNGREAFNFIINPTSLILADSADVLQFSFSSLPSNATLIITDKGTGMASFTMNMMLQ